MVTKNIAPHRCSTCSIPLAFYTGAPDSLGRCGTCSRRDARSVDCGCGFLYAGESCGGHEPACEACGVEGCTDSHAPLYRWEPADDFESVTVVAEYEPIGREATRQRERAAEVAL